MKSRKGLAWTGFGYIRAAPRARSAGGSGRGLFGIAGAAAACLSSRLTWAGQNGVAALRSGPSIVLTADSFEITPQPPWIHSDIKAAVMRDGSLAELSVLDPDLTKRVVQAFELNAWVAEALWASKQPGRFGTASRSSSCGIANR